MVPIHIPISTPHHHPALNHCTMSLFFFPLNVLLFRHTARVVEPPMAPVLTLIGKNDSNLQIVNFMQMTVVG
jgi:hypothetical protein